MDFVPVILFLLLGITGSILTRKLTATGALTGGFIGFCVYLGCGWTGISLMGTFFLLGTIATSWKKKTKEKIGIAQEDKGRRNVGQVLANGGIAAALGLLAYFFPAHKEIFLAMMAASFSSATADTLSSELGSVYGKKFINILTFKKDKRGLDGVISLEGTLIGIAGSLLIALVYLIGSTYDKYFVAIIVAGTIGNLTDSFLGASLERKGYIHNDVVNVLNTAVGAAIILLFQ